jgi:hypothetical protein
MLRNQSGNTFGNTRPKCATVPVVLYNMYLFFRDIKIDIIQITLFSYSTMFHLKRISVPLDLLRYDSTVHAYSSVNMVIESPRQTYKFLAGNLHTVLSTAFF